MQLTGTRPAAHRQRPSTTDFAVWYLMLLMPTVWFKHLAVTTMSNLDLSAFQTTAASDPIPRWWLYIHRFLPFDCVDAFVIVGVLFLVSRLLKAPVGLVMCGSLLAAVAVGVANAVSLEQTGAALNGSTMKIGWNWGLGNPGLAWRFFSPRLIRTAAIGGAWALCAPLILSIVRLAASNRRVVGRLLQTAMVVLLMYSLVEGGAALKRQTDRWLLTRGLWSGIALSMFRADDSSPLEEPAQTASEIASAYDRLAYPQGHAPPGSYLVDISAARRIDRNIVIIVLETAPQKYYPIVDDPDLPVFHAMSKHALVSDRHYTSSPMSTLSIYSLMTGTYPRPGSPLVRYGDFQSDGLATTLERRGYETTYVNAYELAWNGTEEARTLSDLGFSTILDSRRLGILGGYDSYAERRQYEMRAFEAALERVRGAAGRGRHALVFLMTQMGHFDWTTPLDPVRLSSTDAVARVAGELDHFTGNLLQSLKKNGLADDTIVVVVGDHGLRFRLEFESLDERPDYGDLTFNVPFMIYAPQLFDGQIRLPYATSHVDLTPTLLDLMGITCSDCLYHGSNMLDRSLEDRVVFMPSGSVPGLHPVDAFRWRDYVYSVHDVSNRVTVRRDRISADHAVPEERNAPFSESEATRIVRDGRALFNRTAGYFLRPRRPKS